MKEGKEGEDLVAFYLASNTAFTKDVLQYAEGTGLKLLGVNAPADESFIDKIRRYKLYPVTSIRRIKKYVKDALIENDVLTCKELLHQEKLLYQLGLKEHEIDLIFKDIHYLLERNS